MITFALFADATLTAPLATLTTQHLVDGTSDPVDAQIWIGSTATGTQLRADSDPGVDQLTLSIVRLVPVWAAAASIASGAKRRPTTSNGFVYQAGGAGTTDATEPTWPTTIDDTVIDNDITWTCVADEDVPAEYKLATTEAGLATATAGAALNLGTTLLSGVGNAQPVWVRVENDDTHVQDQTHLAVQLSAAREDAV